MQLQWRRKEYSTKTSRTSSVSVKKATPSQNTSQLPSSATNPFNPSQPQNPPTLLISEHSTLLIDCETCHNRNKISTSSCSTITNDSMAFNISLSLATRISSHLSSSRISRWMHLVIAITIFHWISCSLGRVSNRIIRKNCIT